MKGRRNRFRFISHTAYLLAPVRPVAERAPARGGRALQRVDQVPHAAAHVPLGAWLGLSATSGWASGSTPRRRGPPRAKMASRRAPS
eukprot:7474559-Pyramimonas_sp.AAC.1